MKNEQTKIMAEIAIMSALGIIFDLTVAGVSRLGWVAGGSIGIQMLPIFVMAYRRGLKEALLTGFIIGSVQMILPYAYILNPIQAMLDYSIAYLLVGFSGLFTHKVREAKNQKQYTIYVVTGIIVGGLLRLVSHTISGVIYFSVIANIKDIPTAIWSSLVYNGSYMIPSIIICALVIRLLPKKQLLNI